MEISDLSKDIRRILLEHWSETEINDRLKDPVYFFDHVVNPRLDYLRAQGQTTAKIRLRKDPKGQLVVILNN